MDPAVTSLTPDEKRALLADVLRRRASSPVRAPLSPGQERLWRLLDLDPESPVYNLGFAYSLKGPIDVVALEDSLAALARRHEALRTAFAADEGVPMQVIAPEVNVRLERMPLAAIADADFPAESRRIAGEAARARIDLARAPLWRFVLLERSDSDRVLLVLTHHIISDRWSVGLLMQELAVEYAAVVRREASPIIGPAPSYREAIRRLVAEAEDGERHDSLTYWRALFDGGVPDLILPTGVPAGEEAGYRGMRQTFELSVGLATRIRSAADDEGTTAYVILVAALAAHLHGATGQTDVVFTTPVSGRHRASTRGVIGYFNNLLPIRLAIAPRATFRDLVRTAAAAVKGAFEHQNVPFHRIAELPGLHRARLTRCLIAVQNTTSLELILPGVESTYEDVPTGTANFDLAVLLEEQGARFRGWVDAKSGLWSPAALEQFVDGFLSTLEAMAAAPDRRLAGPSATAPADPRPLSAAGAGPADRARNELERRMIAIWEDAMGLRPLAPDSHFFDLGGHSLLAARIFDRIGQAIGREVPLAALLRAPTIRRLADLILCDGDAPCWAALVPVQPRGERPPLFCVHGGGGGVLSYTRVAAHLGEDRPVWGLQAPKREDDPARPLRVEEMAADYLRAMISVQPEGPYHLCGHSFGGLVAFEIARQLADQGRPPALLVVIDYPGPGARITRLDRLRWFFYSLSQLTPRQRVPYVLERLRYRIRRNPRWYRAMAWVGGLLGMGVNPGKAEYRLRTMSATMTAMELYRPGPYPGRLTLFRARGGDATINSDRLGGWGGTALGGVEVHDFPCDHMEIFEEPNVRAVAADLRESLDRTAGPPAVIASVGPMGAGAVA